MEGEKSLTKSASRFPLELRTKTLPAACEGEERKLFWYAVEISSPGRSYQITGSSALDESTFVGAAEGTKFVLLENLHYQEEDGGTPSGVTTIPNSTQGST